MAKPKKTGLEKVIELVTEYVDGELSKLPRKLANAKRKKIHQIAVDAVRSARAAPMKSSGPQSKRNSVRSRA